MYKRQDSRPLLVLIAGLITVALNTGSVYGQYFGQNKVRFESYDFQVLKTEHFDIHYYDEEKDAVREAARMAERWYLRLSTVLRHQLPVNQPIILYANHPAFRATSVLPDTIGESTGGVTEGLRRRVIMPMAGPLADTDHVLGHELVHAFQYDIAASSGMPGALNLPLWFIEGMAEYLSVGPVDPVTAMWIRDAVRREDVPTLAKLDDPRYFPYRFGQAFWAYVGGKYGDDKIGMILKASSRMGLEGGIKSILGMSAEGLSKEWQETLLRDYTPVLKATAPPEVQAAPLIQAADRGGNLNVAPVLSPDGSRVIFFSERGLFSIDLFLADAQTGRVLRKLTRTAIDPHLDSLQFVNSAGAWSPEGNQFAFGTIVNGRPELAIYDVASDAIVRRVKFPRLGEILNLTWSPDGNLIAFSAMSAGVTDLFVLDLRTEGLRALTADAFADLHPAWSPDGTGIAFVTDRFGTNVDSLSYGQYRLAVMEIPTGAISAVPAFDTGKHINPQWSADSNSLYFVSDRDGISNIYRVARRGGSLRQVTNLQTGVSGISNLSPAFSVASKRDRLVFTAFEKGNYSLYRIDAGPVLAGGEVSPVVASLNAAALPPGPTSAGVVVSYLANPADGLASTDTFTSLPYKPRLSLDYIAPPSVSVGAGDFGAGIGGATAFSFSDLLGRHNLNTTIQTTFTTDSGGFLNNFAAVAVYWNQKSRWTWGFGGGQVPYVSGEFRRTVDQTGRPVVIDSSTLYWQKNREIQGLLAYPFNRANRVEFSAGYRNIGFDGQTRTEIYDLATGQLIGDQTQDFATAESLNMGVVSGALVYDTSIFGGTSPVVGQRYRLEFERSAGSLNYSGLLADYRRYFQLARPLTIAGRVLHYGRYGGDSQDSRLQELFIGSSSLVRGYSAESFSPDDCGAAQPQVSGCPAFDRLIGSRVAVANVEVRVPIFGALGLVYSPGVPPVETALFYDAGAAWTREDKVNFLGGSRRPVTSYGATMRVNILGFAIGEINYAHPNDRPAKRWVWEFNLSPGF